MPRRPKGFDPLASLFEPAQADTGLDEVPLDESGSASAPAFPPVLELTDPFFSAPEEGPRAPARRLIGPSGRSGRAQHITSGDPDIAVPDEMPISRPAAPPPPSPRRGLPLATGALPPELVEGSPTSFEQSVPDAGMIEPHPVAPAEPPPPSAPPPPAEPPPPIEADPVELAKALARAAVAKAGPPKPSQRKAAPPAEPAPPAEAAPPQPKRPLSRVEALSQRAVRPKSAQDVIQRATEIAKVQEQRAEERRRQLQQEQAALPGQPLPPLVHKVQRLIERKLKGLGPLRVNNCIVLDDREVLRALWRAHRARFGAEGKLDQVVGAAAVLDAFDLVPEGKLVAAHVLTEASDYLVWLDMREGTPLAAFADARAYFVGQQTGAL
jgi:hypothetical protein